MSRPGAVQSTSASPDSSVRMARKRSMMSVTTNSSASPDAAIIIPRSAHPSLTAYRNAKLTKIAPPAAAASGTAQPLIHVHLGGKPMRTIVIVIPSAKTKNALRTNATSKNSSLSNQP
jgi:hypothetical protein